MNKFLTPIFALTLSVSNMFAGGSPGGPWAGGAYYPGQLDGRYSANVYNDARPAGGVATTNQFTVNPLINTNSVSGTNVNANVGIVPFTNQITGAFSNVAFTNSITNSFSSNFLTATLLTNVTVPSAANVVSGVLGFALRNGTPATVGASNNSLAAGNSTNNASYSGIGMDNSLNYFVIYVNGEVFAGSTAANINPKSGKIAGALFNGAGRISYQLFTNQQTVLGGGVANVGVSVISFPGASASGYFNANVKNNKSPYTFSGKGGITTRATGGGVEGELSYTYNLDGIKSSENSISAYNQTGRNAP